MNVFSTVSADEVAQRIAASHESVRAVHDYWHGKAAGRPMPARADIDPVDLKSYLPMIILIDVVDDDRRFVYRLVGTREVAARGDDPTGKSVIEAHFSSTAEEAVAIYDHVRTSRRPFCFRDPFPAPDGRIEVDDIVFLPLSDDAERVNMILVYSYMYQFRPRAEPGVLSR